MTSKSYLWKCFKCGYILPEESDLLKICPNCNALGEFIKINKEGIKC